VRAEALALRPADCLRRVAEAILFVFTIQVIAHAVWTGFSLPEVALPVVLEAAFLTFWLSRLAAIARLARRYRITADAERQPSSLAGSSRGTSAWMTTRAARYVDAAMRKTGT
jgi:hypothetical protein